VQNLVLVGRSGVQDPDAAARIDRLRAQGTRVVVEAADVSDRGQLATVLDRIGVDLPVLRGVLHCAMVLDDALLPDLGDDQVKRVLAPKVDGARHLHELTADLPIETFVLFSSASSLVGNVGQANYAAANAYLDRLAEARRAEGLPALAVNWGAVSDAGYVARHEDIGRLVEASGLRGFAAADAYRVMTELWHGPRARVGVIPMDWQRFFRHHGMTPDCHPSYERLFDGPSAATAVTGGSLGQQLRSQAEDSRGEVLSSRLRERVATVLGIPLVELDADMPLMDYLDSLLAVEISSWLERELDAKVTIIELMKGPSVNELTSQLLGQLERAR
jgi:NAD(P)-dependent dehydrogenase (short-subunit alcohol dehydrogenase family)/acyl carrier protein